MARLQRPWSEKFVENGVPFGPADCLLSEYVSKGQTDEESDLLMEGECLREARYLFLHPYPKHSSSKLPDRENFPIRPKIGQKPRDSNEQNSHEILHRMNQVLARTQELEGALEKALVDPKKTVWRHLEQAWDRAKKENEPQMSDIVRQARELTKVLRDLEKRIRRVLRRNRELTPLDRVQEMDRASVIWLSRQPGRTVAERASSSQRIMATVRRENFDTLENRVLFSYLCLAEAVAREWMLEHCRTRESKRYQNVDAFRKTCHHFAIKLSDLGVTQTVTGITPNYVLMQDQEYRLIYEAWLKLLKRENALDDLWAWQAQTWTDFIVLAIVLVLNGIKESELIAQSPIIWRKEAIAGRLFDYDQPLAVFWLKKSGWIIEIQARPDKPGMLLMAARAHVALKITDIAQKNKPRFLAIWTPHALERLDLNDSAEDALSLIKKIQQFVSHETFKSGLILTPTHGCAERVTRQDGAFRVDGIALGASGDALAQGMSKLSAFAQSEFNREAV